MRARHLVSAVIPFMLFACAHSNGIKQPEVRQDVITEDEIARSSAINGYEVVTKLRANFFANRGRTSVNGTSNSDPTVYVDDQPYGPLPILKTIPASQISLIRLYRSWEATTKYGTGNMGGVIAVSTKQ